jgi:hypothetical protein
MKLPLLSFENDVTNVNEDSETKRSDVMKIAPSVLVALAISESAATLSGDTAQVIPT